MSTGTDATAPILIRAKITEEEWTRIRKEAIDRRLTTGEFVGQLLRAGLECVQPITAEFQ